MSSPAHEEMLARARVVRELGARAPATYLARRDGDDEHPDVVFETFADLSPRAMERVAEIARTLRDAPRHPHVVTVLSAERIGDGLSVVTDFVDGVPLEEVFFGMSLGARLRAVVDVLSALSALHSMGVVHGGVLLRSSFVEKTGRTKLGFAYRQPLCVRREGYAPEVLLGDESAIGPRSDVYEAGVLLWEAVTGRALFGTDPPERVIERQLADRVEKALPSRSDRWARTLLPVVDRALAVDPAARFGSIAELAAALRIAVRARLMMHEDVIEEIWPAATTPKVTSGVQPAAEPIVVDAAPQAAPRRPRASTPEPPPAVEPPAPIEPPAIEPDAPGEGAASGIVTAPPAAVARRPRRIGRVAVALAAAACALVGALALMHARGAHPVAARADAMPEPDPNARVELSPASAPVVTEPQTSVEGKPAASSQHERPRHKASKHRGRSHGAYDPQSI